MAVAEPNRVIVPAYGNPCCGGGREMWNALIDAARPGVMDVILNPNSGPGAGPISTNYIGSNGQDGPLIDLAGAGATILGYVHTQWGERELAKVLDEIDRYFDAAYYRGADFQLSGIFVDEMSNDLASLDYYRAILQHVHRKSERSVVVGNPGTASVVDSSRGASGNTVEDYATLYERLVTFENNGIIYRNQFAIPGWIADQPAERFAHIIHSDMALEKMRLNVRLASSRNVGTLYVTDDVLANPYDRLPTYWNELLDLIVPAVSIDELSAAIRQGSTNHHFDMNQDGRVDQDDRHHWVTAIAKTSYGDANLDGRFDSSDLIAVFQAGEYEVGDDTESLWSTGDWTGDGEFTSEDLTSALATGEYESVTRLVSEPSSPGSWFAVSLAHLGSRRGRIRKNSRRFNTIPAFFQTLLR